MWKKLKNIHYMFHIALVFIIFPIAGVIGGDYSLLLLLWTAFFIGAYYNLLLDNHPFHQWLSWWIMIAYIFYSSIWLNPGYVWYIFYLSNLLIYHFNEFSFKSWRFWSFFALQPIILFSIFLKNPSDLSYLIFLIVTFIFADLLTFGLYRMQVAALLQEEKRKQNAQLNLFLAENERNRIGRDLHDSLGHTFAMLSVKTELAQQFLQMQAYEKAGKELQEVHEISKQSMADVRRIIDNLKTRTLADELVTIQAMLEMSGIQVQLENQLNVASIPAAVQSGISMILLELTTNIIKHAQAKECTLKLFADEKTIFLDVQDDGIGFQEMTAKELHSVRDRLLPLFGQVDILSRKHPTHIRVQLPFGGGEE
ncbi:Sensor histidine kinase DesK [Streptococcus constellatus]|uniref:histidine kinase n=1 Tax=Streptococcus constellatus TaxID=76860 RepID=A0A564TRU6_STRCV|nr:sensor histidine kinase [Streptococcus constellatus]VUX00204.1 Sensor histidine kinase DesK [Streptococcus gordonii]VUX09930.1 Sensor histidine kinase DesK [Streptococcus constellatus]